MAALPRPTADARRLERLIVTRPAPEAQAWVHALREKGWPAQALPLIHIGAPDKPAEVDALRHWRAHWLEADAILFVSGAAVSHFFAQPLAPAVAGLKTRFWAPGPGTARLLTRALYAMGLDAGRIDSPAADAVQFDSEHLWPRVVSQVGPGRRVLIVRGTSPDNDTIEGDVPGRGRDWLIHQCLARGASVEACVAYVRRPPVLTPADEVLIREAAGARSAWLFSSSESLRPLRALRPEPDWSFAGALVTHPRIGEAARDAGFGHVLVTRPELSDVMRTLESVWYRP